MYDIGKQKHGIFFFVTILFILAFVLLLVYGDNLFNQSLQFIIDIQTDNQGWVVFFNLMTNLIALYAFIIAICLCLPQFDRLSILGFLLYFSFLGYILTILKTLIHQPRPYWVNHDVKALDWTCFQEYGNPSGHSMFAALLTEFILIELIFPKLKNALNKIVCTCVTLILIVLTVISRMFLGMHAGNQVLLGLIIGFYCILCYRFYLKNVIKKMILKIMEYNKRKMYRDNILLMCMAYAVFIGIVILIFYLQNSNTSTTWLQNESLWLSNIQEKCPSKQTKNQFNRFYFYCFLSSSLIAICFSLLLGLLFTKSLCFFQQYKISQLTKRYQILQIIIILVSTSLFGVIELLPSADSAYLQFLWNNIALFCTMQGLTQLGPFIITKFQIIKIQQSETMDLEQTYVQINQKPQNKDSINKL